MATNCVSIVEFKKKTNGNLDEILSLNIMHIIYETVNLFVNNAVLADIFKLASDAIIRNINLTKENIKFTVLADGHL